MAGVRGFNDANLQTNNGVPVWQQLTTTELTNETTHVTPWYINYLGGNWSEATQCMIAGSNGWHQNHAAWNHGTNDHWAMNNTPWSIGFYRRHDLPTQWALADNWIVADMYQVSEVWLLYASSSAAKSFRNPSWRRRHRIELSGPPAPSTYQAGRRGQTRGAIHTLTTTRLLDVRRVASTATH